MKRYVLSRPAERDLGQIKAYLVAEAGPSPSLATSAKTSPRSRSDSGLSIPTSSSTMRIRDRFGSSGSSTELGMFQAFSGEL